MNVDRLLAHYERIADAPDAVPRLRRFILDLAVRGKLVAQDPRDEPASKLLERRQIAVSRAEPFELPASWVWVNVGAVAVARLGKMLDKAKNKGTPRRYLRNINVRWFDFDLSNLLEMRFEDSELPEFMLRFDDVLICEGGEPGRAAVWDSRQNDIYFQKAIHRIRLMNIVDSGFLVRALRASADDGRLAEYFTGTGIKHFTGKGLAAYLFPLPPLAEQHRIVAKVDELMALCDRLEVARTRREATRDRLSASSLARLDSPDPDPMVFRNHAAFALEHLTPLTTRRDQIEAFRQTILNLAVRGKLVAQDPNDEPASKLLERRQIIASRAEPFELPASWVWVNVGAVAVARLGKMLDKAKNKGTPRRYLRNINVRWFDFDLSNILEMRFEDSELPEFALRCGDVLVCEGGEPGRAAVWDGRRNDIYFQKAIHRIRFVNIVYSRFFVKALRASADDGRLVEYFTGTGIKHFTGKGLAAYLFPLPPLTEQHRIVAKVDELMALCDGLETSLTIGDDTRCRLLEALLIEALESGGSYASEQAERAAAHG